MNWNNYIHYNIIYFRNQTICNWILFWFRNIYRLLCYENKNNDNIEFITNNNLRSNYLNTLISSSVNSNLLHEITPIYVGKLINQHIL